MSTVTPPSIGRKLWLYIDHHAPARQHVPIIVCRDLSLPFDASIAFVHPKEQGSIFDYVAVSFADHDGRMHALTVPLRQPDDPRPVAREWVEWPKFQREQPAPPAQAPCRLPATSLSTGAIGVPSTGNIATE